MTERRRSDRRYQHQDYLMTEHQVAEMAKVSVHTVRYWRQLGILPSVKVGKHPRVWHSAFLKVFQKPLPLSPFGADKMLGAGDIRRVV